MNEEDKLFINAAQQVWHSPSVEQIADSLRVALMTTAANEPLSAEYRPHVLLLCEAYGTRHSRIAKLEHQLKQETDRHASVEEHWMVEEARYKAEVKRLEMFIHRTSGTGMEAVALARAGSLIRGNRPGPTTGDRITTERSTVSEGTGTLDGCELSFHAMLKLVLIVNSNSFQDYTPARENSTGTRRSLANATRHSM
jgi:mannose-6-phosphate isomerase-like protein (cupin superfamily)